VVVSSVTPFDAAYFEGPEAYFDIGVELVHGLS